MTHLVVSIVVYTLNTLLCRNFRDFIINKRHFSRSWFAKKKELALVFPFRLSCVSYAVFLFVDMSGLQAQHPETEYRVKKGLLCFL